MKKLTKENIGKRLLVKRNNTWANVQEAGIFEISPSGEYIKIQLTSADGSIYTEWVEKNEYVLVEELNSVMDNVTEAVERFEKSKKKKGKNKSYWEKDNVLPKPYQ